MGESSTDPCAQPECDNDGTVHIHDPRGDDRIVCTAHARVLATHDGVVAHPIDDPDPDSS